MILRQVLSYEEHLYFYIILSGFMDIYSQWTKEILMSSEV